MSTEDDRVRQMDQLSDRQQEPVSSPVNRANKQYNEARNLRYGVNRCEGLREIVLEVIVSALMLFHFFFLIVTILFCDKIGAYIVGAHPEIGDEDE